MGYGMGDGAEAGRRMAEDRGRRADGGRRIAEDRGRRADGGRRMAEDRGQRPEGGCRKAKGRRQLRKKAGKSIRRLIINKPGTPFFRFLHHLSPPGRNSLGDGVKHFAYLFTLLK